MQHAQSQAVPQKKRGLWQKKRKQTKRRLKGISPQGMQLPIVTDPYSWPEGIVRGGAASQQEDAVDEGGGWGQSVLSVNSWWGEGWSRRKKGGSCRFKSYCTQRSGSGSQVKHTVSACQPANSGGVLSCFNEYRILCKMCVCCLYVWCVVLWDFCAT